MINHHAICYIGSDANIALQTAQLYLCGNPSACNACNSCIKAQNSIHPDIINVRELMPDGKYKIGELRKIISQAGLRPNDGDLKVYIFTDTDEMPPLCQNALLKFTEEPPEFVRIIFTAKSKEDLLETIRSRVVFETAENDVHPAPQNTELQEIAASFVSALKKNNEYLAASILTKIKTRDELAEILLLISLAMMELLPSIPNLIIAQKFLLDKTEDLLYNPNITLFTSHLTAEIFNSLK